MVSKNKMIKVIKVIKSRTMGIRIKTNTMVTITTREITKKNRETRMKLRMKKNNLLMHQRKFSPSQPSLSKKTKSTQYAGSTNTRNATERNPASLTIQKFVANI